MFKTDRVYVDSQLEALKARVEWLEEQVKALTECQRKTTDSICTLYKVTEQITEHLQTPVS